MHVTSFSVSSPNGSCGARENSAGTGRRGPWERGCYAHSCSRSKHGHRMVKSVPLFFDVLQKVDSPCLNCFIGKKNGPIVNFFVFFPLYLNIRHYHKLINTTYRVNAWTDYLWCLKKIHVYSLLIKTDEQYFLRVVVLTEFINIFWIRMWI